MDKARRFLVDYFKGALADRKAMFVMVVLMCAFLNMAYMHVTVFEVEPAFNYRWNYTSNFFMVCDIAALFIVPLLFVRKRLWIFLVPYFILTLLVWINVGYSRYFDTYLPATMYSSATNLTGLSSSVLAAIEISDLFLLATSLIVVIAYLRLIGGGKKYGHHYPSYLLLALMVICGLRVVWYFHTKEKNEYTANNLSQYHKFLSFKQKDKYFEFGIVVNYIDDIMHAYEKRPFPEELEGMLKTESAVCETKTKNTILILVESLCSYPIGKTMGQEITPNINKLINEGCYYHPRMLSQNTLGESSDGQMTYLTGYLPSSHTLTINRIRTNELITLPSLFKKNFGDTRMTIPTHSSIWSQGEMCKVYGIDSLYSYHDNTKWLNDEQLFKYAASKDIKSDKPFFSIILTSSTHLPWDKKFEDVEFDFPKDFSDELKTYLANVHYMDKWLGWYMESLRAKGIYDDTMIVIVADHKPNGPKLNIPDLQMCADIPLIIVNSPAEIDVNPDERIYQTSLFPTILDLWGIESDWRGVGYSLLYKGERRRDLKLQQQISEALIYSDFFNE